MERVLTINGSNGLENQLSSIHLKETITLKEKDEKIIDQMNSSDFDFSNPDEKIKCILLCEFHYTAGPKIVCQMPNDYISKEEFGLIHPYVIPKIEMQKTFLSV